jgi:hypothetical protein
MEVEQLLVHHPHMQDARRSHSRRDARRLIVAFVDADRAISEQEILEFVRERAASFKVPHHVLFRSTSRVPRVAGGKVAKHRLVGSRRSWEAKQPEGGRRPGPPPRQASELYALFLARDELLVARPRAVRQYVTNASKRI